MMVLTFQRERLRTIREKKLLGTALFAV